MPPERDGAGISAITAHPGAPEQAGIVDAAAAAVSGQDAGAAHAALPGILSSVPVAVLVIDRKNSAVTYANTAAVEIAGNIALPVDVDTWGAAAGLTDLAGEPLASSSGPLSTVAQGRPVTGEAIRLSPGRSTDWRRADADEGDRDQLLWVTGFPLSQAGSDEELALVVFLQLDPVEEVGDPDAYLQALRERAVIATDITFTITDPRKPDNPLVWVNPSFTRVTGYEQDDVVGRNCRFLQGPATDPAAVDEIRRAIAERSTVTTTLLNYRKDGTAFWNQLSISPVFDGSGDLVSFVGVQTDVTERVRVEHEREAAFAAEQAARREAELARSIAEQARSDAEHAQADAERAQTRLSLMAEATGALIATLDMSEVITRLAQLCVPRLADWVFLTLLDEYGQVQDTAHLHRDGHEADLRLFSAHHARNLPPTSPSRQSIATARPVLVEEFTAEAVERMVVDPVARAAFRRMGARSGISVPMVARRRTLGALAMIRSSDDVPSRRTTSTSPRISPAGPPSPSTTCGSTSASTPSPTRCSARSCRTCPRCPASRRPRTTSARPAPRTSAATSTTCCRCPTARSASRSATWSGTTSRQQRPWGTSAVCCGPASGTPRTPTRAGCSRGSTGWCRACASPRWRRWSTPAPSGRRPPARRGGCTSPTPATRRCCCASPTAPSRCSTG